MSFNKKVLIVSWSGCSWFSNGRDYSGGPTEIRSASLVMSTPSSSETSSTTASLQQEISALDNEEWPEGDPIPLNARRVTLSILRQIGEALGVPSSSSATNAELKLMVEGRLTEMGYDPANVQVIVSDDINEPMYLVNDEGVIKRVESVATHVTQTSRDDESSALRVTEEECARLRALVNSKDDQIRSLQTDLTEAKTTIEQLRSVEFDSLTQEVERLKGELSKEASKAKRFWKLRCDQMLKCEEEMERKDTELALLKARLLTLEGSRPSNVPRPKPQPTSMDPVELGTPLGQAHRGKAPPVEPFTGERSDQLWEEWLPTLERRHSGMAGQNKRNSYNLQVT